MKIIRREPLVGRSQPVIRLMDAAKRRLLTAVLLLPLLMAGVVRAQSQPLLSLENENVYSFLLFDILEAAPMQEGGPLQWDMTGSIGKEYNRFWVKSDGDLATSQRTGEMEFQALYSRLIAPYWEAQAGLRFDVGFAGRETSTRTQFVVGLEGLAPYWFELEPALFISDRGDVSASLTGTYDVRVTQRLIVQPRLDVTAAVQEVKQWGMGSGLNSIGMGARLRYEIRREFAPYVGISWTRLTGSTADLAHLEGEDTSLLSFVVGVRLWR